MGFDTSMLGVEGVEAFTSQPASAHTTADAVADEGVVDGGAATWMPTADAATKNVAPEDEKKQKKELKEEDYDLLAALVRQLNEANTAFYIEEAKAPENLEELRKEHKKNMQTLHEPILLTLGNSEQKVAHILTRDLFDLSQSAKVFFEITRVLQDSPSEEKLTYRLELEHVVSEGLTREIVRKTQESQRASKEEPQTEEEIKKEDASKVLDKIIENPNLDEEKKSHFRKLKEALLALPGEFSEHVIQGTHIDQLIEFLLVGGSYGSSSGSFEHMKKKGEDWLVGHTHIVEVFGQPPEGNNRCFHAMEETLLEIGDTDVQNNIQNKNTAKEFLDEEKKFDFSKYKMWLISKYKLFFAIQRDAVVKKLKEQLCDGLEGRRGIKVKVKDEQKEVDERESKELRLSQDALDLFLEMAMDATEKEK
ncbi:MAG: hypothetical protein HZA34_03020 [Candidatus Pacebacteria bacterium]|nr:hypothetical protein [Candidatus Paceibacterota bacterium]